MPIQYKVDILAWLKQAGYSTYKIRKGKIMSESTLQKFRNNEIVTPEIIAQLCELLHCQPGDLLEYVNEASENSEEPDVIAFTVRKGARELLEDEAHCCGESLNDFLKEAAQDKYYNESGERIEL